MLIIMIGLSFMHVIMIASSFMHVIMTALSKEPWNIKTITALLEFQHGPFQSH